ncbi:MAG: KamA family radical SAM protein [bacterium]|nr:KamA family radical SAM protein [bacterium]
MHTEAKAEGTLDVPDGEPPSGGSEAPAVAPISPVLAALQATPQWQDWRWQMRNRIRSLAQLQSFFPAMEQCSGVYDALKVFQMAITPYYAGLIRRLDGRDPIFRMAVPQRAELCNPPYLQADPLEEDHHSPVPGLIHRYADRALIVATSACAMYCRHCTRKRVTSARESSITGERLQRIVAYLGSHPEIRDVVVSGGDPLTLSTEALEQVLAAVRGVPSVEIIRIGTRVPVTMPMRITDELTEMLRKYHPLWLNTHFNHPVELTEEARAACAKLADAGIPLGNQTVLLRGVNDDPRVMEELCRGLVRMRVRPYYLFQCDLVPGVEHFRTPLSRGIEIMEYLRGRVSGLAIPTFVVDAPGGGGKIPVFPNYVVTTSPTHTVLRNFEGMLISYPEPRVVGEPGAAEIEPASEGAGGVAGGVPGVWELASGRAEKLSPHADNRPRRRARKAACAHAIFSPMV